MTGHGRRGILVATIVLVVALTGGLALSAWAAPANPLRWVAEAGREAVCAYAIDHSVPVLGDPAACGQGGSPVGAAPAATSSPSVALAPRTSAGTNGSPGAGASGPAPAVSVPVPAGSRYVDVRYGFSCVMPAGWSVTESDNGDGATATDPTGRATMSCFGHNTLGEESPAQAQAAARAALAAEGVDVTYAHLTDSTYALSGTGTDGTVSYEWYAIGAGSANAVVWRYPTSMKSALDADLTDSVNTFRRGDLAQPH